MRPYKGYLKYEIIAIFGGKNINIWIFLALKYEIVLIPRLKYQNSEITECFIKFCVRIINLIAEAPQSSKY